ncbi:hypothetical protein BD560DRAFT_417971, partial [Blakeslea trispora]
IYSNNINSMFSEEKIALLQQRLVQLKQFIQNQPNAQAATELFPSSSVDMDTQQSQDHPLHSFEVRPSFNWTPSPFLSEVLGLDSPLFTSASLTDDEKSSIVQRYPPI